MGRHAGGEVGNTEKKPPRAGMGRHWRREVLASPTLCSSSRLSQALAPFPLEAAGQEEAGSEEAAGELTRHQLLRSLWGGGMGHLLQPEVVGGSPWRQG